MTEFSQNYMKTYLKLLIPTYINLTKYKNEYIKYSKSLYDIFNNLKILNKVLTKIEDCFGLMLRTQSKFSWEEGVKFGLMKKEALDLIKTDNTYKND